MNVPELVREGNIVVIIAPNEHGSAYVLGPDAELSCLVQPGTGDDAKLLDLVDVARRARWRAPKRPEYGHACAEKQLTDEVGAARAKREQETLALIRESFEKAAERKDSAFYLRPESAWLLLRMAERGAPVPTSNICLERKPNP